MGSLNPVRSVRAIAATAVFLSVFATVGHAQEPQRFPTATVKIIVPTAPGGTGDALPRRVAAELANTWKHSVVIENLSGGGGNIGAERFSRATPDGLTLLAAPPNSLAVNQSLYKHLDYDPNSFEAITILATSPNILVVPAGSRFKSVQEIIDYAKKNPGALTYASPGIGSTGHLAGAQFESVAGVRLRHVPYRGTAPAMNDVLGGHVDMIFDNVASSLHLYRSGKTRVLMACAESRLKHLPEIPTSAESGLNGFISASWIGLAAPAGTPREIVAKINKDVVAALHVSKVQAWLDQVGLTLIGDTPEQATAFLGRERARSAQLIKAMGIQIKN